MQSGQSMLDEHASSQQQTKNESSDPPQSTPSKSATVMSRISGAESMSSQQKQSALRDFKRWKKVLINMIKSKSRAQVSQQEGGKSFRCQFILPPDLVRLVWQTTINERVSIARTRGSENPLKDALEGLQAEIADASARLEIAKQQAEERGTTKQGGSNDSGQSGVSQADGVGSIQPKPE